MNRVQLKFINDAQDQPEKLSDWESDFIDSLADKDADYVLSTKQNEILNRIQRKLD